MNTNVTAQAVFRKLQKDPNWAFCAFCHEQGGYKHAKSTHSDTVTYLWDLGLRSDIYEWDTYVCITCYNKHNGYFSPIT